MITKRVRKKHLITVTAVAGAIAAMLCLYSCAPTESSTDTSSQADIAATAPEDGKDSEASNDDVVQTGAFTFSPDADCATCHETEGNSLEDTACPASNHATFSCVTCHSDVDALANVHDGVEYGDRVAKRLKKTEVDTSTCTDSSCHGSLEDLAVLTTASTVLTDKNGTTVNPHALPDNPDHESINCASCHDMHSDKQISQTAPNACKGCHHMDVYECYTCHE